MDVKPTFVNGNLEEEVYIEYLEGFQLSKNKYHVCSLNKSLYGLKKSPRSWYSRLEESSQWTKEISKSLVFKT